MSPDPAPSAIRPLVVERLRLAWRGRQDMLAGLLDAGFASLATFIVGVYAVRALEPSVLGGYALVYQAIFLLGIVPANLVFVPAEVAVVEHPVADRLRFLGRSLKLGVGPSLFAGFAVLGWLLVAPAEVPADAVRALTISGILTAVLTSPQDHLRRMLHSGGASWMATVVSAVQLVVAAVGAFSAEALGIPPVWVPFGVLGVANLVSLTVGVVIGTRRRPDEAADPADVLRFGDLARGGVWLVWGGLLNPATGFVSAALVSHLASAAALGYAEAARVVAQPVWVLAVGISFVFSPRSMEAAKRRDKGEARKVSRLFLTAVLGTGLVTLGWFGPDWTLNPLAWLLPAAYVVTALVPVTIVAQILSSTIFPYRSELLGAGGEATYTRVELVGSVARTGVSASASWTGPFAIPLGIIAVWGVRWAGFRRALERIYRRDPAPGPVSPPDD